MCVIFHKIYYSIHFFLFSRYFVQKMHDTGNSPLEVPHRFLYANGSGKKHATSRVTHLWPLTTVNGKGNKSVKFWFPLSSITFMARTGPFDLPPLPEYSSIWRNPPKNFNRSSNLQIFTDYTIINWPHGMKADNICPGYCLLIRITCHLV